MERKQEERAPVNEDGLTGYQFLFWLLALNHSNRASKAIQQILEVAFNFVCYRRSLELVLSSRDPALTEEQQLQAFKHARTCLRAIKFKGVNP